ncbi:MAG: hypothetical protein GX660_26210 [Clostridiaceae bacterium]|nr:hypothetical protein [Clostridiaceae bacterium]
MKIKNITKETLIVPGVGTVKPGEIVDAPEGFHNTNFEILNSKKDLKINNKEEIK